MKIDISQEDFWEFISSNQILDEKFIMKYFDSLHWDNICEFQKLSERTIFILQKYISWYWTVRNQKLSEEFIENKFNLDAENWNRVLLYQNYSNDFLFKHIDKIQDWFEFRPYGKKRIPTKFFDYAVKHNKGIDWTFFADYKKVNNTTLKKYKDIFNHMEIDLSDYTEKDIRNLIECGIDLKTIYSDHPLSEQFINEYKDKIDWDVISRNTNFSLDFVRENQDKINWWQYSRQPHIPYEVFVEFGDRFEWYIVSNSYAHLDKRFLNKFGDRLNIRNVMLSNDNDIDEEWLDSIYPQLSAEEKEGLYKMHNLSEEFIEKHLKRKNEFKKYAATVHGLSEKFIERNKDRINWLVVSYRQKLSEKFIEKFADRVDWAEISINQKLSEKFLRKHVNDVEWGEIILNQKLSMPFINELAESMDFGNE